MTVVADAERIGRIVQGTDHYFFGHLCAIEIDDVFGAVVYHHHVGPGADGQFVAIAGVHVGDAVGVVGRPDGLTVRRQGDFPALLPAAERKQEDFAVGGQFVGFHPEAYRCVGRIELRRIGGGHFRCAIEPCGFVGFAKTVFCKIDGRCVVVVIRFIQAVSAERVICHEVASNGRRGVLRSIQSSDFSGAECLIVNLYIVHCAIEKASPINRVVADAERVLGFVQCARHQFLGHLCAVEIDDVLGTIVHHDHVRPGIERQRRAGVHVAAACAASMGGENRFAVARQRDFPALLPAAVGEQVNFAGTREAIGVYPKADGGVIGLQR